MSLLNSTTKNVIVLFTICFITIQLKETNELTKITYEFETWENLSNE